MLTQLKTQKNIIRKIRLCGEKSLPAKKASVYWGINKLKEIKLYIVKKINLQIYLAEFLLTT